MKIDFPIDEDDYLTFQLYSASKSEFVKKNRAKTKVALPLVYAGFALIFLVFGVASMAISFLAMALIWLFLYPLWEKRIVVRNCKHAIRANFKGRLGKVVTLEFTNTNLTLSDGTSETKVPASEIEEINAIPSLILIKLKSGQSFIIPEGKVRDIEIVRNAIQELAVFLKIQYNIDENWTWK